jgi:hypothetical protein
LTVEVISFAGQAPEHLGGSARGRQVLRPFGEDRLYCVEANDVAAVRVVDPDPDVELFRRDEIPEWRKARMRERLAPFLTASRMQPGDLTGREEDWERSIARPLDR